MLTPHEARDILPLKPPSERVSLKLASQTILVAVIVATVAGAIFLIARSSGSGVNMEILLPTATPPQSVEARVYVTGAVSAPGVYTVGPDSRLVDAIAAAGGATEEADLAAVNLAARVRDEQHWHIPRQGEARAPVQPAAGLASPVSGPGRSGKICLNSSSSEAFQALPRIGDVKAGLIVEYRDTNGAFTSVEQLLDVPQIGPATLDEIRELVEVC